jgi:diphthine methyl ester acylhydrolase
MYQLNSYTIHDGASIPALYLAWMPGGFQRSEVSEQDGGRVDGQAVTFSDGSTSIFSFSPLGICGSRSFTSHEGSEVWFVAVSIYRSTHSLNGQGQEDTSSWSEQDVPFLFTGNDFGTFRTQRFASDNELDSDNDSHDNLRPVIFEYEDKARHHTAGITSILPLPINLVDDSPIVLTGSYDEYLRVYHATRRGNVLAKRRLGGGVWRLSLLGDNSERTTTSDGEECLTKSFIILASCMHAGVRVLRITYRQGLPGSIALNDPVDWEIDVLAQFTEHESMNYASDVWKYNEMSGDGGQRSSLLCISSSFYDRRVCVWEVNKRIIPRELCYDV